MSSAQEIESEPESPPLFNYLRQEIPLEDLMDYASPRRIQSIDFVKGFAIIFIILAHTSDWLDADWYFLFGLLFALLDILGPSLFVFLSALSVIFTIKRKEGIISKRLIRNSIFTRGVIIIIIGMLINVYIVDPTTGQVQFVFFCWHIFVFIGIAQIVSYFALKLKKLTRVIIGVVIIIFSPLLRDFLYLGKEAGNIFCVIFHYLITSPRPDLTFLPWISISFLSTIFGEYLYDAMIKGTEDAYVGLFRLFFVWGFVLVLIGIFGFFPNGVNILQWQPGWVLQTPYTLVGGVSMYPHIDLLRIANNNPYFQLVGFPSFLVRHTSANMFYNFGMAILIIAISFYFIDIKKKGNMAISMFIYYGKISLSLFLLHLLFLTLFLWQFNVIIFLYVSIAYIAFLGILMYIWMEYGKGVGSPEWLMVQIGRIGHKTGDTVRKGYKRYQERKKLEEYFIEHD